MALEALGAHPAEAVWLAPGEAVDVAFSASFETAEDAVRQALNTAPIDVIVQKTFQRRKKLLIADMDSTIVVGETLDDLAACAGLKTAIADITRAAMKGERGFADALKTRVALLKGLDESCLQQTLAGLQITPGAEVLVQTMRANGATTALISGGFSYFTDRVRERVGFHSSLGNQLDIQDGTLTGKVIPPIVDKNVKLEMLIDMTQQQSLGISETMTIGDGANDVPMLTAAGTGIAYHAHPIARQAAPVRLDFSDLTGALFVQGYRVDEFVQTS